MKSLSKAKFFALVSATCAALFSVSAWAPPFPSPAPYGCPGYAIDYDEVIQCEGLGATCKGTKGKDILKGDIDDPQQLNGGDGDDCLIGGNEGDVLNGGKGDDYLDGGAGNDILNGGWGEDDLYGGPGDDVLLGGLCDDYLNGEGETVEDECHGGNGIDVIVDCEDSSFGREPGNAPPNACL